MKDTGAWLEGYFRDILPEDCYQYKPTDFKTLMHLIANFPQIASRIPKVPCDRIVIYKGKSYFFELKHQIGASISFDRLASHQIGSLLNHQTKGGGKSYVVLGFQIKPREHLYYCLPIQIWISLLEKANRKSLRYDVIPAEYSLNKLNILSFLN
jgi:penicillin-binding protein-related factor A (putative recombinase)